MLLFLVWLVKTSWLILRQNTWVQVSCSFMAANLLALDMAWLLLILAGMFEIGFTTCLAKAKETAGTAYVLWLAGFFVSMAMSMYLLYRATLTLPMGTAYAVWTGIGAAGTAIIGILFFKESVQLWRLFFLTTLILSIVGLKFVTR